MIIEQPFTLDLAAKYRGVCSTSTGAIMMLRFDHLPSQDELDLIESQYIIEHEYDSTQKAELNLYENMDLIIESATKLRQNPNLSITQYNTYLSTKKWHEAIIIRFFVYKLAVYLSIAYNINLGTMTETLIMQCVRDWVCTQPIKKVRKVIFGVIDGGIE